MIATLGLGRWGSAGASAARFASTTAEPAHFRPKTTAELVAFGRFFLSKVGLLDDLDARRFIPAEAAALDAPGGIEGVVAQFGLIPGAFSHMFVRTRWHDRKLIELTRDRGIGQVVICGAGLDTRALRLPWPPDVRIFELDLPESPGVQNAKKRALERDGVDHSRCEFLPIDLRVESVDSVLCTSPTYDKRRKAAFLWEGVTAYLTRDEICTTVNAMRAASGPGSRLLCELWSSAVLRDDALQFYRDAVASRGEPYTPDLLEPEDMKSFWSRLGVRVEEHYGPDEQLRDWIATPGWEAFEGPGRPPPPPHGGAMHMFMLEL